MATLYLLSKLSFFFVRLDAPLYVVFLNEINR